MQFNHSFQIFTQIKNDLRNYKKYTLQENI